MADLPQIDLRALEKRHPETLRALYEAGREVGTFLLWGVPPALEAAPLALAQQFFALDEGARRRLDIARSSHFRGFSVMHNERDWREQIHFGRERPPSSAGRLWDRLEGPNLWPDDDALRADTLAWMAGVEAVGRQLLDAFADVVGLPAGTFAAPAGEAYTLMKFIRYHAQPGGATPRRGVAAHCDFSWLTLLFQDAVGGLEVMDRAGRWIAVPATPGAVVVNVGELLPFAAAGALFAAPHRVMNPSSKLDRLSVPVFINPPLAQEVRRVVTGAPALPWPDAEHVHRVLPGSVIADARIGSLHFGHAEWRRKGENLWCSECSGAQPILTPVPPVPAAPGPTAP